MSASTQLTVDLAESEITFLMEYADKHKITIAELIDQYVKQLRIADRYSYHPDIEKFTGIVRDGIDAKSAYYEHIEEKHR